MPPLIPVVMPVMLIWIVAILVVVTRVIAIGVIAIGVIAIGVIAIRIGINISHLIPLRVGWNDTHH
jgi:hypothetical protein